MGSSESAEVPQQSGNWSTINCNGTVVNGNFNTVIGNSNKVNGNFCHVYGHYNQVNGNFSKSFGNGNRVNGNFSSTNPSKQHTTPPHDKVKMAPWNAPKDIPEGPFGREEKEKNSNATTSTQQITATAPPLDAQVIPTVTDAVVISEPVEPKAAQNFQLEK